MNIQNLEENNGSANSYIIQKPGTYSFPLIYGNGNIKEGECFDYLGRQIKRPEISEAVSCNLVSWDSSREFISQLELKNNRILTTISYVPKTGANYIIAVRDKNGTIIWSWHLWLWRDELKNEKVDEEVEILNIDLASVWLDGKLRSWYYQWGRKDPMYPGGKRNKPRIYRINDKINPISYPLGYVSIESWYNTKYLGSWAPEKTIYDPCPPGYKVPDPKTLEKLNSEKEKKNYFIENEVAKIEEHYFYLNGFRGIGTRNYMTGDFTPGLIAGLDTGRYWANNPGFVMIIYRAVDGISLRYSNYTNKLNAMSIRPQKI